MQYCETRGILLPLTDPLRGRLDCSVLLVALWIILDDAITWRPAMRERHSGSQFRKHPISQIHVSDFTAEVWNIHPMPLGSEYCVLLSASFEHQSQDGQICGNRSSRAASAPRHLLHGSRSRLLTPYLVVSRTLREIGTLT
jgi:hypothetical protein